jgi:hypothetical protein
MHAIIFPPHTLLELAEIGSPTFFLSNFPDISFFKR